MLPQVSKVVLNFQLGTLTSPALAYGLWDPFNTNALGSVMLMHTYLCMAAGIKSREKGYIAAADISWLPELTHQATGSNRVCIRKLRA